MTTSRARARATHLYPFSLLFFFLAATVPRVVLADRVIAKGDDWEVYTNGRVAGFLSWVTGDPPPVQREGISLNGGLWPVPTEPHNDDSRGTVNMMRLRSGFLGNQLGFGVRGQITPWTTVTGYVQLWAYVESEDRNKSNPNPPDVRQGYAQLEGLWGSFTAGRQRTLTSRGATDINVMYGHKWGVGFPNSIERRGPTLGMVGFGVLGSGFGAGMVYGTPSFGGLQLNVGIFDPATLGGPGWNGTKWARPETELKFERDFGATGKVVLFANGAYQKVYKPGQCNPAEQPCEETVVGVGYGGRFEIGPARLGVAGHYGKGLGMSYALENSYAVGDAQTNLRWSDGYYVQAQVVARKFDFFAGWGIARLFLSDLDKNTPGLSVLKYQMGINGGVVYNVTPNVHVDLEYFLAKAAWWLGETQVLHCPAAGMTFNW
ncbi:MAG: porin [Deltaproteobacteria bacterium]|nr:porin [Deltaproteobacteria bacterium]